MKIFKLVMVLALSSPAMAQDYYSPTDKVKEPVARFPLGENELKIKTNSKGEKFIEYELPKLLTGEINKITATEIDIPGADLGVRIFSGKNATITCMGTEEKPGCMVTHKNLKFSKSKAEDEITKTYSDPVLRAQARGVMDEFQDPVEHSGNQPIGVLGGLKPRDKSKEVKSVLGTWTTKYDLVDGTPIYARISLTQVDEKTFKGEYRYSRTLPTGEENDTWEKKASGTFKEIKYFGTRVIGRWEAAGKSGWFEFNFNPSKTAFDGYYGSDDNGSQKAQRVGRWSTISVM